MAGPVLKLCGAGARWCGAALLSFCVWTLWLALCLLLAAQIYIARTNELSVPFFVQRALEARLAVSGVRVSFGHARFDPSGRILAENVRVWLPGFEDAMVTARAIYVRIDPWALLVNRFEPVELRVTGASFRVPALLSPSGRADEVVRDLDGAFLPRGEELGIEYLNCHVGNLAVSVQGGLHLGEFRSRREASLPLADFLARNYATVSRECAAAIAQLARLDRPGLRVRLTPSETAGAALRAVLQADGLTTPLANGLEVAGLRITGQWPAESAPLPAAGAALSPFHGGASVLALTLEADAVRLPATHAAARGVRAWLEADLTPGLWQPGRSPLVPRDISAVAAEFSTPLLAVQSPIVVIDAPAWLGAKAPAGPRVLVATLRAWLWDEPLVASGRADLDRRTAEVQFRGRVGPAAIAFGSAKLKRDLRRWADLTAPIELAGTARFDSGWKFARVAGRVHAEGLTAKDVRLDEIGGRIEFDGRRLWAPELSARLGEDFVRGTFEQDLPTRDYRFLLKGRLRPLDITPWIAGAWWRVFFGNFEFPAGPPDADVDLRGRWTDGKQAAVFVAFNSAGPIIRGVTFDRAQTRLFIRPHFDDGLELSVARGPQAIRGTFTRRIELGSGAWQSLDLDLASTLDLDTVRQVMGPATPAVLGLFASAQPPSVRLRGHLDGPAAADGPHQSLHIEAHTPGPFRYSDFPVAGADFTADVRDDEVTLSGIRAGFAGGSVAGQARIRVRDGQRRLEFDAALHDASLGQAIETVNAYTALRAGRPPPPASNYARDKANIRLDADLKAEGGFGDLLSFHGDGSARLQGSGLGEVRLLGSLSGLISFMSLRFTSARATFKIEGPQLVFSDASVTGANSGIVAHGTYALDSHTLDFRATVNPFQESKSLPQRFMDVMLTPLADVLAVKLTGTLEKPTWAFVNGPTSFLRGLAPAAPASAPSPLKAP